MNTLICHQCGNSYKTNHRPERSRYCSRACLAKAQTVTRVKPPNTSCAQCGKPLKRKPNQLKKRLNSFCDTQCWADWQRGDVRPNSRVTVLCGYCGKPKQVFACRLENKRGHFCNLECHGKWQTKHHRVSLICQQCGSAYDVRKYFATVRQSRFCSLACRYAATSIERMGSGNVNWKGGIPNDYGPHWGKIARAIRKRDNHTCQHCGKQKRGHDVHHIKPLCEFDGDLDSAHDPQNLITLCRRCHKLAEYGKIAIQPRLL